MNDELEPLGLPEPVKPETLSTFKAFVLQHPLETMGASLVMGASLAGLVLARQRRRTATRGPAGAGWTPLVTGAIGAVAAALAAAGAAAAKRAESGEPAEPAEPSEPSEPSASHPTETDTTSPVTSTVPSPEPAPVSSTTPVVNAKPAATSEMDWATAATAAKEE